MNTEQTLQMHPIMKTHGVKVHWKGAVGKITSKGDVQQRYLVISTIGIFLLTKRTFPSGYKLSRVIPISRLKSITLTTDYVALDSPEIGMIIQHEKINEISAILISLQNFMMGSYNFKASTQLKLIVSDIPVDHAPNEMSPIVNRFISECLALSISVQVDQIHNICSIFDQDKETLTFTPALAASSLMPAMIQALSGETDYKTIVLKDLSFMQFFPHFSHLLESSTSVENLVFYRTSFLEKNLSTPPGFFEKKAISPIHSIVLRSCDLTNQRFREFFYEFSKIKTNITAMTLDHCDFVQSSLESIFYSIFDSPCFRSLGSLVLNKVNLPESIQVFAVQLLNCDWVLKNKSLKKLVLQNTPLQLEFLLNALMMFETGLEDLSLAGCTFSRSLPKQGILTFQEVRSLDLSGITVTAVALLSLFQSMENASSPIVSLDFTSLKMSDSEATKLYSEVGKVRLGAVQTLVWDGNKIPDAQVSNFIQFLSAQTSLIDLSISNCIPNSPINADHLAGLVSSLNLERFVMVASGNYVFGPELNNVIDSLISRGTLTSLDITGHNICESGLKSIIRFVQTNAKCIAFGHTSCNMAESLLQCLNAIKNSSVEFAMWPAHDVKRVITKVPLGQRDKMLKEFGALKKEYEEKYKLALEPEPELTIANEPIRLRRMSSIPLLIRSSSDASFLPHLDPLEFETASYKETSISTLLVECLGPTAALSSNDSLVVFYNQLSLDSSLEKFAMQ